MDRADTNLPLHVWLGRLRVWLGRLGRVTVVAGGSWPPSRGALAAAGCAAAAVGWRARRRRLWWLGRLLSLGLLWAWVLCGVAVRWSGWQTSSVTGTRVYYPLYPGFFVLATGGTLVCIGVWLIPPRHGRGGTAAELTSRPAGPIGHRLRRWLRALWRYM